MRIRETPGACKVGVRAEVEKQWAIRERKALRYSAMRRIIWLEGEVLLDSNASEGLLDSGNDITRNLRRRKK